MEASSAAATYIKKKRKHTAPTTNEKAKRLKTEPEGEEEVVECTRPPRSSRVSVPLDRLQQPVTLKELTELLHYAALGKTGGVKQPR